MKAALIGRDVEPLAALRTRLMGAGVDVRTFPTPQRFFSDLRDFRSQTLIAICWPVAEVSGEAVIRRIRGLLRDSASILVLADRDVPGDVVSALEAGADDFIPINASPDVLMARIRALSRRHSPASCNSQTLTIGDYEIDYRSQSATVQGVPVALTPKEFDLFWVFASKAGQFVSKAELMTCVWGRNADTYTHTVSQHVHALRTKLHLAQHGLQLMALYGAGYRLGWLADAREPRSDLLEYATGRHDASDELYA